MKLLFIARTYPPLVGGMEKFAIDFYDNLNELADTTLIANPKGKKAVFLFFIKVMAFLVMYGYKYEIVHFNDAILSPLIPIIRLFSTAKVTFTVHGLDIVYQKFGYQTLIIPFLRHADKIFPVSVYTKDQCIKRGINEDKLLVIPNGINFSHIKRCDDRAKYSILSKINVAIENKKVLLSLGRLIERKGHGWFIENVVVDLPEEYVYLIAGDGPEAGNLKNLIKRLSLESRVFLLGYVPEEEKACLFQLGHRFIMPNIHDKKDQEGFGIVLLEAGTYALPSIAANIEGIKDAVIDGVSGVLVEEKDAHGFFNAITQSDFAQDEIPKKLRSRYDWHIIRQTYFRAFKDLLSAVDSRGEKT